MGENARALEGLIDPASAVPASAQLRQALTARIADGTLAPGTRLPAVRSLAQTLGLAANTVARAYRELEQDGIVETRGRHDTTVASTGDPVLRAAQRAADQYVRAIRDLGLDDAQAVDLVRRRTGG